MPRIGLALGGGGVRGLAHIAVLELLDELELRPAVIAGTSMGALVGALYASGHSGTAIREITHRHFISRDDSLRDVLDKKSELLTWLNAFLPATARGGLFRNDRFLAHVFGGVLADRFEDLAIPLVVVAADFWSGEEVAIKSGALLPALRATSAVPGVYAPVEREGRILVDGGLVNQVPYDHLGADCDLTIAVDTGQERVPGGKHGAPNVLQAVVGALDIMQDSALEQRLRRARPDILVRMRIRDVDLLEYAKAGEVMKQAQPAIAELRARLAAETP
ncbi:MAG: patatin-like phospholipase family protein [Candidatus Krumholzibacteriota bacterium]|nr:patatin-like phospholipase family protein [Candidatus Krumholzibacteriota bacterium]